MKRFHIYNMYHNYYFVQDINQLYIKYLSQQCDCQSMKMQIFEKTENQVTIK